MNIAYNMICKFKNLFKRKEKTLVKVESRNQEKILKVKYKDGIPHVSKADKILDEGLQILKADGTIKSRKYSTSWLVWTHVSGPEIKFV